MKIIRVAETFTLRKIDFIGIAQELLSGKYANRELPEKKIRGGNVLINLGKEIGNNGSSEVYRFKDKHNNNMIVYTTNHSLYKYVTDMQNGKVTDLPILKCKYCKRGNLKKPIGLPLVMEYDDHKEPAFYVVDSFCDFGCVFSYLKRKLSESKLFRTHHLINAEQLLYCYYYRVYPHKVGQNILSKPDWELLRENGGSLTDEEFDGDRDEYVPISSLITLPAKKQYLKLKLVS